MKTYTLLLMIAMISISASAQTWTQKSDFPGGKRYGCASLAINGKAYMGLGNDGIQNYNDWWEYDPINDSWTAKTSFPGEPRYYVEAVELNGKGYVGLGSVGFGQPFKDWYEYDPVTDAWTAKAKFPAASRYGIATFTIDSKGYFACGNRYSAYGPFSNQLWEYDAVTNLWTQKATFPGAARYGCEGFSINGKGYVGLGGIKRKNGAYVFFKDFYEYDPANDTWAQKANYPNVRSFPISFVLNGKGYLGLGHRPDGSSYSNFYAYDPSTDTWEPAGAFPGSVRSVSNSWVIDGKGYVAMGKNLETGQFLQDVWEFSLDGLRTASSSTQNDCFTSVSQAGQLTVNPESLTGETFLKLYTINGQLIRYQKVNDTSPITLDHLSSGEYIATMFSDGKLNCSQKVSVW